MPGPVCPRVLPASGEYTRLWEVRQQMQNLLHIAPDPHKTFQSSSMAIFTDWVFVSVVDIQQIYNTYSKIPLFLVRKYGSVESAEIGQIIWEAIAKDVWFVLSGKR